MFLTAHTTVAISLCTLPLANWILFPLAFISHYLVDIIPHGDEHLIPKTFTRKQTIIRMITIASIDACGIAIIMLIFFNQQTIFANISTPQILIASTLACVPDGLQFIEYITKGRIRIIHLHQHIHTLIHNSLKKTIPFKYGILVQIIFVSILISLWH